MKQHLSCERLVALFALFCSILVFNGCSKGNKEASYNPDTGHAAGWSAPASHGNFSKTGPAGFESCRSCHGADFSGGVSRKSCFPCHTVNAPHAAAPWRGGGRTHTNTNPGNAAVCALCHQGGANSSIQPNPPAAGGAQPGCFNNTLCHATPGHPAGWADPASHGATAKTRADGFAYCESCHGADFTGGEAQLSCFNCHGVNAPHAAAPWRGPTRTHTDTAPGNAPVCAQCHLNGVNSSVQPNPPAPAGTAPGCFNSTLCHAAAGHPTGWSSPGQHGATAEQDFTVCKTCHGAAYQGGTATITCYDCHNGPGLNHPAPAWVVADHKTAAVTDSTVCKKCHGADYLGGGAHIACTSCHMENQTKVHMLAWYPDVRTNHRAYALANGTATCSNASCHGTNLTGVALSGPSCSTCHTWPFTSAACGSCHGIPPAGSSPPDTAGGHAAHAALSTAITCGTCHAGAGSGTVLHQDGTVEVVIDGLYNAKAGTASFNNTAKTCSNVSCHGGPRTQTATQAGQRQSTGSSTPSWLTGSIDVNTQCTTCHVYGSGAAAPENNSYYSGEHYRHVYEQGKACTACHDTARLAAGHFTSLNNPISAGAAAVTLKTAVGYNGATCNPSAGGLTGCHSSETW